MMYIVLHGDTHSGMSRDEILTCSATIVRDKQKLQDMIDRNQINEKTRIFEVTRELRIKKEVTLSFEDAESNESVEAFTYEEILSGARQEESDNRE